MGTAVNVPWGIVLLAGALLVTLKPSGVAAQESGQGHQAPGPVDATEEPEEPPGYRVTVLEAVREYNAHNFAEAHALFEKAHSAYPNARTLRGLGMVEFELKRYQECIDHLQQALDSEVKSLDEVLRSKAEDLLNRARNFVASVHVQVVPTAAQVVVDGEPAALSDAAELLLRVGDHVLEFRAPGHYSERRVLQLSGGEQRSLQVVLTRQVDFSPVTPPPRRERKRLVKNAWLWSGLAALGAGSAVALTLALRDRTKPYDGGSTGSVLK